MKVIATIFQCKRVSLPYFFVKYCVPKMRELSGFDIEVYLIQHTTPVSHCSLETSYISGTENVKKMTENGSFEEAHIIQHSENNELCPPYPSYRRGVEISLKENADLHMWMEDDALIMDLEPLKWLNIKDVGTYTGWNFIPVRHTIVSKKFDQRMIQLMHNEKWDAGAWNNGLWNKGPIKGHPEYFMKFCCKHRLRLKDQYAIFHHDSPGFKVPINLNYLKKFVPEKDLKILNLDYPNTI